ncbi:MAG TPA: PhzF family phenazine biosynthesis protein [Puia sp.]|nr:PhzF family phenazine biosynthesis protein [Puia sp.]
MQPIPYYHADVFSNKPLSGNGLIVFTETTGFSPEFMLRLTQEMRQFESIFLQALSDRKFRARVFTCEEEVDFAGHPVLGAAAILHGLYGNGAAECNWEFQLNAKTVSVRTQNKNGWTDALMNQGVAEFEKPLNEEETRNILSAMNLSPDDGYPGCSPLVVSTGLPYLLLPLQTNGLRAKIMVPDLEERLARHQAKFIGTLEMTSLTIRTWDNAGLVEDIATGSLAGPCGAYLVRQGFREANEVITLQQGHNLGRPSELFVELRKLDGLPGDVYVGGSVVKIASGTILF